MVFCASAFWIICHETILKKKSIIRKEYRPFILPECIAFSLPVIYRSKTHIMNKKFYIRSISLVSENLPVRTEPNAYSRFTLCFLQRSFIIWPYLSKGLIFKSEVIKVRYLCEQPPLTSSCKRLLRSALWRQGGWSPKQIPFLFFVLYLNQHKLITEKIKKLLQIKGTPYYRRFEKCVSVD